MADDDEYLAEWNGTATAICVIIILLTVGCVYLLRRFTLQNRAFFQYSFRDLATSSASMCATPQTFLVFRALNFIFCLITMIIIWAEGSDMRAFTDWGFFLLTLYFTGATLVSWVYCRALDKQTDDVLDHAPSTLLKALKTGFICLQTLAAVMTVMIDVVYWTVLSTPDQIFTTFDYTGHVTHLFNVVLFYADFMASKTMLSPYQFPIITLYMLFYIVVTFILVFGGDATFPYDFLETRDAGAIAWYLGLVIFAIGLHLLISKCCVCRKKQFRSTPGGALPLEDLA